MSRNNAKSTDKKTTYSTDKKTTPSCAHCKNLGLKNDHWLRANSSPDSAIVCPVLLKTECRYCHKMGHNISKCQRLADSKKEKEAFKKEKTEKSVVISKNETTIHIELNKTSYAAIAKNLLNVLQKKPVEKVPYEPPSYWVPHGRLMDWTEGCDSSDDEN